MFFNSLNYTIEENKSVDDTMPPIYDDYNDGCECFTPTVINKGGVLVIPFLAGIISAVYLPIHYLVGKILFCC